VFFLGGSLAPLGLNVNFLDAPFDRVFDRLRRWRREELGQRIEVCEATLAMAAELPLDTPWIRELLFSCGSWTCYLNNDIDGGDPTAAGPYLCSALDVRLVVAMHAPLRPPGHAATQLWILGPDGEPPLMYERTIAAYAEDGHWSWDESGSPLPFEQPERYSARRIRDRFDRGLLVDYLGALGIDVDSPEFYGEAVLITQIATDDVRAIDASTAGREFDDA